MSFTETKTESILKMEQKLQIQLQNLKNFIEEVYKQSLPYWNAIKSILDTCWQ